MDALSKLSREAQVIVGGGVLLFVLSFLDWQQTSVPIGFITGGTYGWDEWHGIGVLAGLLVVVLVAWEIVRLTAVEVSIGTLSPGLVSLGLALLMALFTVVAFFNKSLFRHWPAWIALILALVVAAAAVTRARAEGVQIPHAGPAGSAGPTDPTDGPSA